jgi:hypothetical protein
LLLAHASLQLISHPPEAVVEKDNSEESGEALAHHSIHMNVLQLQQLIINLKNTLKSHLFIHV